MKLGLLLGLLFSLLFVSSLHANNSIINVRGVPLKIGLDKKSVLKEFQEFKLQCFDYTESPSQCDSIIVSSPSAPFTAYANLVFDNNQLESVRKYWREDFSNDADDFIRTLHYVLSNISKENPVEVVLKTTEQIEPGFNRKKIIISKGSKTIEISILKGATVKNATSYRTVIMFDETLE